MKHLTKLFDLSSDEVRDILNLSLELKEAWKQGHRRPLCQGMVLVQIFEKPSLRTRVSFEAAMMHLGGSAIFLSAKDAGLEGREPHVDVARVVGGYSDVIVLRTFTQSLVETFAEHAGTPVVNGLSDDYHPCQGLTDLLTIQEHFGDLSGRTLAYVGDGNNVARSLALACAHSGMKFRIGAPAGYQLNEEFFQQVRQHIPSASLTQVIDPAEAVSGADVVYTDVWASMGQEAEKESRAAAFQGYQVDSRLMKAAGKDAVFLHCLPARRGLEVSDEVMGSRQSLVFPQAENRMHLAKGLFAWLLGLN